MKYLYKGMAMPGWGDVSGSVLLGWHEKASLSNDSPTIYYPDNCYVLPADRSSGNGLYRTNYDGPENSIIIYRGCLTL